MEGPPIRGDGITLFHTVSTSSMEEKPGGRSRWRRYSGWRIFRSSAPSVLKPQRIIRNAINYHEDTLHLVQILGGS